MATTSKLGYGNAENLDTAITNGIIDTVYDPASSNTNVTLAMDGVVSGKLTV